MIFCNFVIFLCFSSFVETKTSTASLPLCFTFLGSFFCVVLEEKPSVYGSTNTLIRAELEEVSVVLSAEGSHVGQVNIKGQ